jgi:hypothetical protein
MHENGMFPGLLAPEDEYLYFWNLIMLADATNQNDGSRRTELPFWRKVESALNCALQHLFITGMTDRIQVTIDDDKVHYHVTCARQANEPKPVQHVRDNRRGFVIDTAVYTATGVPVGFNCHGWNDSTATSTRKLIRGAFAPTDGGNDPRCLTNTGVGFDRGYTSWPLVDETVEMGGSIDASTNKRSDWAPFTYDQHIKAGDRRQVITTKGPKALFQQTYTFPSPSNVKLNAFAYK